MRVGDGTGLNDAARATVAAYCVGSVMLQELEANPEAFFVEDEGRIRQPG